MRSLMLCLIEVLARRFKTPALAFLIGIELDSDIARKEAITIWECPWNGPKLRDYYPSIARGALIGYGACHQTVYNMSGPDTHFVIQPEAFKRSGHDVPRSTNLWRYIDDWKFRDLLESKGIYLSGLESLEDDLEGTPTEELRDLIKTVEHPNGPPWFIRSFLGTESFIDWFDAFRKECCVNCWHMTDAESHRFWDTCKTTNSVAIRTTVGDHSGYPAASSAAAVTILTLGLHRSTCSADSAGARWRTA